MVTIYQLWRFWKSTRKQNKQKELNSLFARDKALDTLFNCMYEDNISGKIDNERFARMSKTYTDKQSEIADYNYIFGIV